MKSDIASLIPFNVIKKNSNKKRVSKSTASTGAGRQMFVFFNLDNFLQNTSSTGSEVKYFTDQEAHWIIGCNIN